MIDAQKRLPRRRRFYNNTKHVTQVAVPALRPKPKIPIYVTANHRKEQSQVLTFPGLFDRIGKWDKGPNWGLGMDYNRAGFSSSKTNMSRADPSTINNKFLVGYQGWFTCPGDGTPITDNGWSHWFKGNNDRQPTTDLWPDVSQYPPSELFPVKTLMLKSGEPHPRLFSSRSPGTVHRHFHWMAKHGVDGAFLQRPLRHCIPTADRKPLHWRDSIGRLVRVAAELEHRATLRGDWDHLIQDEHVLDSPNYLREDGRAV
ncbi:xylosidase arabinosidase, partial [Moniliophthora roreri]